MMICCTWDRKLVSQNLNAKNASKFRLSSHGGQASHPHFFFDFFGISISVSYAHLSSSHYIVSFSQSGASSLSSCLWFLAHIFVLPVPRISGQKKNNNRNFGNAWSEAAAAFGNPCNRTALVIGEFKARFHMGALFVCLVPMFFWLQNLFNQLKVAKSRV